MNNMLAENKFLVPSILLLLAALIFAWAVVYSKNGPSTDAHALTNVPPPPHVAENVPHYPSDARQQSGLITSVGADRITIEPTAGTGAAKIILITSQTEIFKLGAIKDEDAYAKEVAVFDESLRNATGQNITYAGPDPMEHIALKIADLTPGMAVMVIPSAVVKGNEPIPAFRIIVVPPKDSN